MSKLTLPLIGGLVVAGLAAGGFFAFGPKTPAAVETPAAQTAIPAAATEAQPVAAELLPDYVMGEAAAPITLIEYASYTCPHCAHWHEEIWPNLKRDYIDTGKVKFIHREVYFDRFGLLAGQVAQCGGAPRYFAISGLIYDEFEDWIGDGKPETITENLKKLGLKAGLSAEQVEACMNDNSRLEAMVATFQTNATKDQIEGTPTMIINGEKHENMSWDALKAILDGKL